MSFDDMCRLIASPASRRDVFKAIFGSLAAASVPWVAKAANPVVVKSGKVRVLGSDQRTCNFKFFTVIKNFKCPANTVKKIDSHTDGKPSPNALCQRRPARLGGWIGEATVRCVRQPGSPS